MRPADVAPAVQNIYGQPVIRPSGLDFGGDGSFYITNLVWSRWTVTGAAATGRAHQNDCVPFCAVGHFHVYAVKVRLSRVRLCSNRRREYTRIEYVFVSARPTGSARGNRLTAPFGGRARCP